MEELTCIFVPLTAHAATGGMKSTRKLLEDIKRQDEQMSRKITVLVSGFGPGVKSTLPACAWQFGLIFCFQ